MGNPPVSGEFPSQRPVTHSFEVFFDLHFNKRLSKQSWGWWFERPSRSLWRHCNVNRSLQTVSASEAVIKQANSSSCATVCFYVNNNIQGFASWKLKVYTRRVNSRLQSINHIFMEPIIQQNAMLKAFLVLKLQYCGKTMWMPWLLLMPWFPELPGHWQPWNWLSRTNDRWSPMTLDLN